MNKSVLPWTPTTTQGAKVSVQGRSKSKHACREREREHQREERKQHAAEARTTEPGRQRGERRKTAKPKTPDNAVAAKEQVRPALLAKRQELEHVAVERRSNGGTRVPGGGAELLPSVENLVSSECKGEKQERVGGAWRACGFASLQHPRKAWMDLQG